MAQVAQQVEGQKRGHEETEFLIEDIKALILDIEGTVLPVDFVKGQLFDYIKENISDYLNAKYSDEQTKSDIAAIRELAKKEKESGKDSVTEIPDATDDNKEKCVDSLCTYIKSLVDSDSKAPELKALQGRIWKDGYESDKLKPELFEDVFPILQQLVEDEKKIYIYSSGSVEAQKLLFGHTTDGDLCEFFTDFFDLSIGSKTDPASYRKLTEKISEEMEVMPEEILFLTDNPEECKAAFQAGIQVMIVDREGNEELSDEIRENFRVIETLNELFDEDDEEDLKRYHGNGGFGEGEDDDEDDEEDLGEEEEEGEEGLDGEGLDEEEDEEAGEEEEGEDDDA